MSERGFLFAKSDDDIGFQARDARPPRQDQPRMLRASANRAPAHGGGTSGGALSSASDDDGAGFQARLREQQSSDKNVVKNTSEHGGL